MYYIDYIYHIGSFFECYDLLFDGVYIFCQVYHFELVSIHVASFTAIVLYP